jgi:hypothetical protein
VSTLLTYINSNADVWVGWTVWNLSPYSISVTNPSTGVVSDTPKMAWYAPYFATTPPTSSDSDGDGIADSVDKCPTVKGVKTSDPSTNGCAPLVVTAVKTYDWGSGYCEQFYFENSNPMAMAWKSMTIQLSDGRLRGSGAVWGAVFPNPTATGTVVATPVSYTSPVPASKNVATVGFCADKGFSGYIGTNGGLAY